MVFVSLSQLAHKTFPLGFEVPPVSFIIIAQSLIGETETQISLQRKNEYEQLIDVDPTLICYYNFRHFESL